MKKIIFALSFLCVVSGSFGQQTEQNDPEKHSKVTVREANDYFTAGDYDEALDAYLTLLEDDPGNDKFYYRIGICYLNANISKAKAVSYLETVARKENFEPDALFLLARAYQYAYRFDDAIKAFNDFKKKGKGSAGNLKDADREIQFCYNAKELMKFPLNVSFENLGKNINSQYNDYFPFVTSDESFIIFNSKRPMEGRKEKNPDGTWDNHIYFSRIKEGVFQKAEDIDEPIASKKDAQEVIGLSSNGDIVLLYYGNLNGVGDIYLSKRDAKGNFSKPEKLDETINSPKGEEIAACITSDGNTIYFASDRPGGFGGTDIYVCKKLPNGKWGTAQNMGPDINTPNNEDFPNISPDGRMFFFSSDGHTGMGGYDIFKTEWNEAEKKFSGVKNLGYPINTPDDNMNFRISSNGKYGYMAALRDGGMGDMDIYRVNFMDIEPEYSVVRGKIAPADTTKKIKPSDVMITVTNAKSNEVYGTYSPNPHSGRYVMILPPGSYKMEVEASGFKTYSQAISVMDKGSYMTEIDKDIVLGSQ